MDGRSGLRPNHTNRVRVVRPQPPPYRQANYGGHRLAKITRQSAHESTRQAGDFSRFSPAGGRSESNVVGTKCRRNHHYRYYASRRPGRLHLFPRNSQARLFSAPAARRQGSNDYSTTGSYGSFHFKCRSISVSRPSIARNILSIIATISSPFSSERSIGLPYNILILPGRNSFWPFGHALNEP